jgi:flagellar hook assembly protein FlgD
VNLVKNNITTFKLYKNYPNPFNSTTTISYKLFYTSEIKLEIYNCSGQRIKVIKKGLQKPGFYSHEWEGISDENMQVSSGVYFIRLSVKKHSLPDPKSAVQKLVLIK